MGLGGNIYEVFFTLYSIVRVEFKSVKSSPLKIKYAHIVAVNAK